MKPNPAEIALAIDKCRETLKKKIVKFPREGYLECIRMMQDRLVNPVESEFVHDSEEHTELILDVYRKQMEPIKRLKTKKGRTLAILCNDWLNGQDDDKIFLSLFEEKLAQDEIIN